jgi:CheY-like chemotaxis protein
MLDTVFELFTQVDHALEKSTGGLGVGLSLVKRLVELHGGRIEARSIGEGQGSTFVVQIPVLSSETRTDATIATAASSGATTRRRILLADDNVDAADVLGQLLALYGHEVSLAHDGAHAVAVAEQMRPEIIVLDIGMPTLNGYDAARRIRAQVWGQSPVLVALTGWGNQDHRTESVDAGFDHHLVKPVDLTELLQVIASGKTTTV